MWTFGYIHVQLNNIPLRFFTFSKESGIVIIFSFNLSSDEANAVMLPDASIEPDTDNAWAADAEAGICTTFKDDGFASDTTWTPPLLISVNGCIDADVGNLFVEPTSCSSLVNNLL